MPIKVFRHAYYGPDGDWDDKDEIMVNPEMVKSWNPKVENPTEFESLDSRTFIEQSTEILDYWKMCGASLLESLDELGPVDDADMDAYVEYRALSSADNALIRSWITTNSTTST